MFSNGEFKIKICGIHITVKHVCTLNTFILFIYRVVERNIYNIAHKYF